MGLSLPNLPPSDGDDPTKSPAANQLSMLGADVEGNARRILVDDDRSMFVHVKSNSAGISPFTTPVNEYGMAAAGSTVETTIVSFTVPIGKTLHITKVIFWGEVDFDMSIKVDAVKVGGGRTSEQKRMDCADHISAPIVATTGQIVLITGTHFDTGSAELNANLLGGTL